MSKATILKALTDLKPRLKRVKLDGHYWTLYVVPGALLGDSHGWTDEQTRSIVVGDHLKGEALLDTLTHEFLHGACPFLCEDKVRQTATELARALKRLGY